MVFLNDFRERVIILTNIFLRAGYEVNLAYQIALKEELETERALQEFNDPRSHQNWANAVKKTFKV